MMVENREVQSTKLLPVQKAKGISYLGESWEEAKEVPPIPHIGH